MTPQDIARESLKKNILELPSGRYLSAGRHQFFTLWSRDFCHSVRGLVAIDEEQVARSHLKLLLSRLRSDGLVPRVMDNRQVQLRVAWQSGRKLLPFLPVLALNEPLKAQYTDEHGSNAFDSNVLTILAALQLGDDFWNAHEESLRRVWAWYDDKFRDGLLFQCSFSDWQDTTKREGQTFLLNLYYYLAARRLEDKGWKIATDLKHFREKIVATFFDGKVFLSQKNYSQVSVEGNLFALEAREFLSADEKKALWENLKAHPLVTLDQGIGRCSYPDWPRSDLAWHIKLARLHRYHGSLSWSWLMGLGLKVARVMGDSEFVRTQEAHLKRILERDGEVFEVYDPDQNFRPWGSWLISSEHPFAWGASYLCEAYNFGTQPILRS